MLRRYLIGAVALGAPASGALVYTVAPEKDGLMNGAQMLARVDRRPVDSSATHLGQMMLTQETLRSIGYAPGAITGIMRFETASALGAFQREQRLKVMGQANPETLAALGIEDTLYRRPR
jgi:peptidoglycan hydrolase-like protein with peptidoglycan-binding domain